MLEQDAPNQPNSAQSRQEVTHTHTETTTQHQVNFQNKTLHQYRNLKKETNPTLSKFFFCEDANHFIITFLLLLFTFTRAQMHIGCVYVINCAYSLFV